MFGSSSDPSDREGDIAMKTENSGIMPYQFEPTKPCSSSDSEDDESAGDYNTDSAINESRLNNVEW